MAKYKYVDERKDGDNTRIWLEDKVITKILRDKRNKDYLLRILRGAFRDDDVFSSDKFEFVDIKIAKKRANLDSETDVVIENDQVLLNLEINYSESKSSRIDNKNTSYMCWLILRQLKSGYSKEYTKIRPVYQLNISKYDQFGKGKFIYESVLMEKDYHIIRSKMFKITDINLDYLDKLSYNEIKNLNENSLEKLLYIWTCNEKKKLDELYGDDEIMERIMGQLYDFAENGDEYLFYDKEEFKRLVAYDEVREEILKEGLDQGLEQGRKQGLEQGRKQGLEQGRNERNLEIAKEMLKSGYSIEEIQKISTLSFEEINIMRDTLKDK